MALSATERYLGGHRVADPDGRQIVVLAASGGTGAAAGQSAATQLAITPVALIGNWAVTHVPATATKATASKAAGAAGVRHICTGLTVTYSGGASAIAAAAPLRVDLIDGASGGTTYLWQSYINVPATAAQAFTIALSGLALVGTAATAMTLEFSAAGGTNSYESVTLMGYSVS